MKEWRNFIARLIRTYNFDDGSVVVMQADPLECALVLRWHCKVRNEGRYIATQVPIDRPDSLDKVHLLKEIQTRRRVDVVTHKMDAWKEFFLSCLPHRIEESKDVSHPILAVSNLMANWGDADVDKCGELLNKLNG